MDPRRCASLMSIVEEHNTDWKKLVFDTTCLELPCCFWFTYLLRTCQVIHARLEKTRPQTKYLRPSAYMVPTNVVTVEQTRARHPTTPGVRGYVLRGRGGERVFASGDHGRGAHHHRAEMGRRKWRHGAGLWYCGRGRGAGGVVQPHQRQPGASPRPDSPQIPVSCFSSRQRNVGFETWL